MSPAPAPVGGGHSDEEVPRRLRELTSKGKTTCLSRNTYSAPCVGEWPPATPPSPLQKTLLMPTYPHSFRRHGQLVQKPFDLASLGRYHDRLINRHHHQHSFLGNRQSLLHLALSFHLPRLTACSRPSFSYPSQLAHPLLLLLRSILKHGLPLAAGRSSFFRHHYRFTVTELFPTSYTSPATMSDGRMYLLPGCCPRPFTPYPPPVSGLLRATPTRTRPSGP